MKETLFYIGHRIIPKKLKPSFSKFFYATQNLIKRGTFDFFHEISIETHTRCNRRCSYCPNSIYDRGLKDNYMPEKLYKKIISELKVLKFNGRITPSFYNEPFLDKRLPIFLKYTKKMLPQSQIIIFTNGDYITNESFSKFVDNGTDDFLITQHGKKISNNLKEFLDNINIEQKKRITFQNLTEESYLQNRGGSIDIINHNIPKKKICVLPTNFLQIDYKGNVILCCNDYHSSIVFGNLEKEKLIDIWNKIYYKKIRKQLRNGRIKLDICKKCLGI
jgi:GTP 3',8-cyclase